MVGALLGSELESAFCGIIALYFIPLDKKDSSIDLENFMYIFIDCKIRIFPRSIARVESYKR